MVFHLRDRGCDHFRAWIEFWSDAKFAFDDAFEHQFLEKDESQLVESLRGTVVDGKPFAAEMTEDTHIELSEGDAFAENDCGDF